MTKEGKGHQVDAELKEKVEQILREVQTAQARKVKPTEVFKKISSYLKKEPALTIPVIEGLAKIPTSQTVQVLQRMMSSVQEKGVTKAAKRTLYRLRQKGVQWKEKTAAERPVLRRPQPGVPQAYLGTMDSTGSRVVVVARPRPLGGVRVYSVS